MRLAIVSALLHNCKYSNLRRQFVAFFLKVKVILIHHGSRVGITGGSSIGGSGVITSGGSSSAGGGSSSQGMREFLRMKQ